MRYRPPYQEQNEGEQLDQIISDQTAMLRWSTEIEEKEHITNTQFLEDHKDLIRQIEKFTPLGFFNDKRQLQLRKCYILNTILAKNAGLRDVAEETSLCSIDVAKASRGWQGNYSNVLVTQIQRHDIKEQLTSETQKKIGRFNRLWNKKPPQEEQVEQ